MQTENENYERHHFFKGYRIYSSFKFIVKQRKIVVLIAVKLKTDHADNLTAGHKNFCY